MSQDPVVKLVVFVPETHAEKVRQAIGESGAGIIGNYEYCSFSLKGIGRYRPLAGATPFIGEIGKFEEVAEERVELPILKSQVKKTIQVIRAVHPYEEPVIEVYPIEVIEM